ncbi:hypothetical protein EYF80_022164 [Liparis tanakae]|uniref:Uncharacterized protein n=1 Tax=Liparis tanakae TaxID=230148 RepID=A0A4Z2HQM8_9TELE|nr:hypothetical protein EYF80_022164 [Liparis tanakae]
MQPMEVTRARIPRFISSQAGGRGGREGGKKKEEHLVLLSEEIDGEYFTSTQVTCRPEGQGGRSRPEEEHGRNYPATHASLCLVLCNHKLICSLFPVLRCTPGPIEDTAIRAGRAGVRSDRLLFVRRHSFTSVPREARAVDTREESRREETEGN